MKDSNLPASLGIKSLERLHAVIRCRAGEIWFLGGEGCEIKPKGHHVHLQMKKGFTGRWYLPVGRFSDDTTKMGHLAIAAVAPANENQSSSSSSAAE